MNRSLVLMCVVLLVSSCATRKQAAEFEPGDALQPGHGLMLLYYSSTDDKTRLLFRGKHHSFETPLIPPGSQTYLLQVPVDEYELIHIYVGTIKVTMLDFLIFPVVEGHITFPGKLIPGGKGIRIVQSADPLNLIRLRNPSLVRDYPMLLTSQVDKGRKSAFEGYYVVDSFEMSERRRNQEADEKRRQTQEQNRD